MGAEGVVAGPAAEGSKSLPERIDYCLRKIAEARQFLDSSKRPPEHRTVHPECINASNPYHECSDYCFRRIADAKSVICCDSHVVAALRRENDELRVANEDLGRRLNVVRCKLADASNVAAALRRENRELRAFKKKVTLCIRDGLARHPRLRLAWADALAEEDAVRAMNQKGKHRASKASLRPVIRHPRYKTQVCRILHGFLCPYGGHRCHFRRSGRSLRLPHGAR